MKKLFFVSILFCLASVGRAQDIKLPETNQDQGTKSMMQTLATRHSVREYSDRPLTMQELSNLCWAACGRSRDESHITAPSAMNKQEIRLFVVMKEGAYEYDAARNVLVEKAKGDYRHLLASNNAGGQGYRQDFVMQAPVGLVMVIDFDKFGSRDNKALMMGCVDAGNVSENINLYCEAAGLCTVPRATMDVNALRSVLHLTDAQLPIMNNPVGHPVQEASLAKVYDETIDPLKQIDEAVNKAKTAGRRVICQVGGNWCVWCLRFADFIKKDAEIAQEIGEHFVYIHVNRPTKGAEALLQRLGNPDRFGYPALVVLDSDGKVLHIQDSALLESGQGYDKSKVMRFLKCWSK